MKQNTWTNKEGEEKSNYSLEEGDIVEIMFDNPKKGEDRSAINSSTGKSFITCDYWLGVKHSDLGEVTVKLTKGQYNFIDKNKHNGSLTGKMISVEKREVDTPEGKKDFLAPIIKE